MLSDLVALLGLVKELRKMTVRPADGLRFSIVTVDKAENVSLGDHLRIINLLPVSICAVNFWLQQGKDKSTRTSINHVYHPSTSGEPFSCRVIYRIPILEPGVFLYPQGMYYVPLSEYPNFDWTGDVCVQFCYAVPGKGKKEGNLQIAARAEVVRRVPLCNKPEPE